MAQIQAFHGLRYDLGHVGSLSDVVAPPYDVIDSELQDELYKRHPANVVRLILNRDEPGDDVAENRYSRAARFLKNWVQEGVLQRESQAAVYGYQQSFTWAGHNYTRGGFMCRVRIEPFGSGNIFPHEETHRAAKEDRLRLTNACRANLSQIFGLFPDNTDEVGRILRDAIADEMPLEATDHLGVVHRLWPVTDVRTVGKLMSLMAPEPIYIADGHHRYETACNYRAKLSQDGPLSEDHPANFVLMMCVGMNDPGLIVLPTHRLFRGIAPIDGVTIRQRLGDHFDVTPAGTGPQLAARLWEELETEDRQGTLALFAGKDQQWLLLRVTEKGRLRMAQVAADHGRHWQQLGVSLLHRLIMNDLLDAGQLPEPMYVHSVEEVATALAEGDTVGRDATGQEGQGGAFPLAALVMPASLEHIQAISAKGERMPAKSTYFYPKLLSGLVINPLE